MFYEGEYVYEYAGERLSLEEGEKHRPSLKPKGHNRFYIFDAEHGSPVCNENRFSSLEKPRKTYKYFPVIPRITRIFQNTSLTALMHAHSTTKDETIISDVWNGFKWKNEWFSNVIAAKWRSKSAKTWLK